MAKTNLLQGTLDMLILRTLSSGPKHGYAITEQIHRISDSVLKVEEGALYPALHRLEERGWLESTWGESENRRRARYYQLTTKGRKQLEQETREWDRLALAIGRVLHAQ